MKTIRKRRRDRTRSRINNQKRLDAIAYKDLNGNMSSSFDTWGGTRCPECAKPLPSRAFSAGYHTSSIDNTCFLSIGTSVLPEFCHEDKTRCYSESAKADQSAWKLSNAYISTKKELKGVEKERQYFDKKYEAGKDKYRNKFNFKAQILENWNSEKAALILRILDALIFGHLSQEHISLADLCFYPNQQDEVLKVLSYITGDRTHLLDIKWYFQKEDGDRYELTESQARAANEGEIRHPVTDELLDYVEASQWVFMYFVVSDLVRKLRSEYFEQYT